jgi:hypothetical protein
MKTITYLLMPNGTIYDGYGQGVISTSGRDMATYTMKFSGIYNDDRVITLNGIMYFSKLATGKLSIGHEWRGGPTDSK